MTDHIIETGISAYQSGNMKLASSIFNHAVQTDPTQAGAWYWLGKCINDPEKAKYCFDRAAKLNPYSSLRNNDNTETRRQHVEPPIAPSQPVNPPDQPIDEVLSLRNEFFSTTAQTESPKTIKKVTDKKVNKRIGFPWIFTLLIGLLLGIAFLVVRVIYLT